MGLGAVLYKQDGIRMRVLVHVFASRSDELLCYKLVFLALKREITDIFI